MLRPDLTTLRVFITVATVENITRASELVHIAPSAISKRLSDFEREIGTKLFYRMHRGVSLTPAGEAVLHYARSIFQSIEQLTGELSDYASGTRGHVRIAVTQSSVIQFLPPVLKSFTDAYPDIKIEMEEENSPNVIRFVAEGRVDLGVAIRHGGRTDVDYLDYQKDELVLIVPRDHPLAAKGKIRFRDALEYDFVSVRTGFMLDTLLSEIAAQAGVPLRIRFRVTSFDAIHRMVSAGLGIGLGPRGMLTLADDGPITTVALDEPWATREICIVVRELSFLSASSRLMIDHLQAHGCAAAQTAAAPAG